MKEKDSRHEEEFIWRFKLESGNAKKSLYDDKRTEMIRIQLKELLGILYLTFNGEKVNVNGFKYYFEGDDTEYKIYEDEVITD